MSAHSSTADEVSWVDPKGKGKEERMKVSGQGGGGGGGGGRRNLLYAFRV
jgi:hypothetical protein